MTAVAIVLALIASVLFAVAAVLQQKGTEGIADDDSLGLGFFATLVKRKVWVAGITADIAGFIFQAAALAIGSLLLVQPLLVSSLLFALPLAAYGQRRRLRASEWFWAAVLIAALIIFLVLGEPSEGITQPTLKSWIFPLAFLVMVTLVCVRGSSRMPHGSARSLVLAIAAGMLLGFSAAFTKTGIDAFGKSLLDGLASWEFWAMAVTATLGTLWQQSSYQAGDVQTSLPTVTVMKPMVAMALGLTIYQEHLRVEKAGDVAVILALIAMWLATFALGRLGAPAQFSAATGDTTHTLADTATDASPGSDGPTGAPSSSS
ncbi:DMT family transporter [Gordonia hirsuta]|uniref:DMT family transporter n=1 Tax=Gordonia hirsuta TaxID=53427 RepID=UPI00145C85D2|nr:DMT family transporter [Gordonia hirsuta]